MALRIRESVYRGKSGFTLSGRLDPDQGWPYSIFCADRAQAERVRGIIKSRLPFEQHTAAMQAEFLGGAQ